MIRSTDYIVSLLQRIPYLLFPLSIISNFSLLSVSTVANEPDENRNSASLLIEPVTVVKNLAVKNLADLHQNNGDIPKTESSLFFPLDENSNSVSGLTEEITNFAILEGLNILVDSTFFPQQLKSIPIPILIAAPENFNPKLQLTSQQTSPAEQTSPPQPISPPEKTSPLQPISPPKSTTPVRPALVLENIQTGFRNDRSNFQQENRIIEPVFQFGLANGEKIRLKTGFNTFTQPKVESVTNIPLQVGWEGKTGKFTIKAAAGIDRFLMVIKLGAIAIKLVVQRKYHQI